MLVGNIINLASMNEMGMHVGASTRASSSQRAQLTPFSDYRFGVGVLLAPSWLCDYH